MLGCDSEVSDGECCVCIYSLAVTDERTSDSSECIEIALWV